MPSGRAVPSPSGRAPPGSCSSPSRPGSEPAGSRSRNRRRHCRPAPSPETDDMAHGRGGGVGSHGAGAGGGLGGGSGQCGRVPRAADRRPVLGRGQGCGERDEEQPERHDGRCAEPLAGPPRSCVGDMGCGLHQVTLPRRKGDPQIDPEPAGSGPAEATTPNSGDLGRTSGGQASSRSGFSRRKKVLCRPSLRSSW